jgi:hypothetical protein
VYGLANENSDYDFLVVTTHEDEPTTWNKAYVIIVISTPRSSATDNVWCGRTHDMNFPGYDDDDVNVSLVSAHYWRRIVTIPLYHSVSCRVSCVCGGVVCVRFTIALGGGL